MDNRKPSSKLGNVAFALLLLAFFAWSTYQWWNLLF